MGTHPETYKFQAAQPSLVILLPCEPFGYRMGWLACTHNKRDNGATTVGQGVRNSDGLKMSNQTESTRRGNTDGLRRNSGTTASSARTPSNGGRAIF